MQVARPITLSNLAVTRGDKALFAGLNLTVEAGQILHLTGRNGAGKTSLLETICGLRQAEEGSVQGVEAEQLHWVGHKNALHGALTPVENLQFWCGSVGADAGAIESALTRLNLKAVRNKPLRMLSTGQKRRTALARLLLQARPWWLLDEPLAGLDVQGVALFAELISRHCAAGGAAFVTSHQAMPAECGVVREWELR